MSAPTTAATVESADGIVGGLAIPFGSLSARDLVDEYFDRSTDFALDWFPNMDRPILYHHGLDGTVKAEVIGRQVGAYVDDAGVWIKAQLDKRSRWFARVMRLLREGVLGWSSGTMEHLAKADPLTGRIVRWPWIEASLTPTPADGRAVAYTVKSSLALEHLKAIGVRPPAELIGVRVLSQAEIDTLVFVDDLRRRGVLQDDVDPVTVLEGEILVGELRIAGLDV